MKNTKQLTRWFLILLIFSVFLTPLQAQKNIILDTDMGPDCDDAGALAVLHALSDMNEVNILGVMACTSSEWIAPCIDAINTYYGHPNIPIGTLKEAGFLTSSKYTKYVAQNFPNDLVSSTNAPDAIQLYRQLLVAQPDNSVILIAIGPLKNLKILLQSGADSYSSLSGINLVAQKVTQLSCMGGALPSGLEWNFEQDATSAQYVVDNWPTPIMFSPFNIGSSLHTGHRLFTETPVTNPVRKAYELYTGFGKDNASWDLTACLYAARGIQNYWGQVTTGYCSVASNGSTTWNTSPDKNHSYITWLMAEPDLEKILEDLMVYTPTTTTVPVTSVSKNKP